MLFATTGKEVVDNGMAPLSLRSCHTALQLLAQLLCWSLPCYATGGKTVGCISDLEQWKYLLAEGETGGGAVMPQSIQIQLQWQNNYPTLAVCAYLSFGGCQFIQPQRV